MPAIYPLRRLTGGGVLQAISLALASVLSYWIGTRILGGFVGRDDDQLGGMWAAIAAAFVFGPSRASARAAGLLRLTATVVSFVLCTLYFLVASPGALGMVLVLAVGALVLQVLNLDRDSLTMAITSIVVMVVAILSPAHALIEPLLRLIDTVVGVCTGIACYWAATSLRARPVATNAQHPAP